MPTQIQWRRDAASTWTSTNPVLAAGEVGYETNTGKFKVGNGSSAWTALSYISGAGGLPTGGTTGQILGKTGSADYAVGWVADQVGAGGGVDAEGAVDATAAALAAGTHTGLSVAYNDAAGSISLTNTSLGGTAGHVSFVYNATTSAPPADTCIRMNATQLSATTLWVDKNDFDGLDVTIGLAKILAGHQIYIQDYDDATKWVKYSVSAAVDSGAYFTFTIAYHSGPGGVPTGSGGAGRVEFQPVAPGSVGIPPGGTTAQALTKLSATDYAVGWTSVVANVQGVAGIWTGTQAAYDAISPKVATTVYLITA
jgi:hypothetical protein